MALSKPFLPLTKLCLSPSKGHEYKLKKELFLLHKYLNFTMEELWNMPIEDRKFYLKRYNEEVEKENARLAGKR